MYKQLISIFLQLLGMYLDKVQADNSVKTAFLKFIDVMEVHKMASVKLHKSYEDQMRRVKKLRDS